MRIGLGLDIHDEKCAAFAVYAGGGRPKKNQQEFLDEFNVLFRRVKTNPEDMAKMIEYLDGHEVHVLIENSTIAHRVYRMLSELGCNVLVAQSADLDRIVNSVKKNDDNDARELAAYMRRRLHGEYEFAVCHIPSPDCMARKELVRAVYIDKIELANTKKRVRARIKIHGADLRNYQDVSCPASLKQLKATRDPYLCYQARVMSDAKSRIEEATRLIDYYFGKEEDYTLLMTIPGIGPVMAGYLTTIIDGIDRFDRSSELEAYFGLVPKQHASANSDPDCRTTHRGDRYAREFLGYAVMAHIKHAPDSVVTHMWHRLKSRGKNHKKVLRACSRKLLKVVWSVLKHRRPFTTDTNLLRLARGSAAEIESRLSELEDAEVDEVCDSMEVSAKE